MMGQNDYKNRAVIISGGDGFIGSHLAKKLVVEGFHVFALTLKGFPVNERIRDIEGITVVPCDLSRYEEIKDFLPRNPVGFFHFAWAGVAPEDRNSFDIQNSNLKLTENAIRLAKDIGAEKFIFPGSTMEYIRSNQIINSSTPPSPQNAYGAAKIAARYYCQVLCSELDIPFIYVVISSIYSEDRKDNNVITYTIRTLLNGAKPSLTKLEQLWDYVHIDDVVEGLWLLLLKGKNRKVYALGHGDNWPLSKYILLIRDLIDPKLPLGIGDIPYQEGKMPMSCVDLTQIKEDTGYIPHVEYVDGIRKVINRFREDNT